jgi:hypothetical protein
VSNSPSYYPTPRSPFRSTLESITGKLPPMDLSGVYCFNDIENPETQDAIQDWASVNANPHWATGLSMIEAAELIVEQAVENRNILSKDG